MKAKSKISNNIFLSFNHEFEADKWLRIKEKLMSELSNLEGPYIDATNLLPQGSFALDTEIRHFTHFTLEDLPSYRIESNQQLRYDIFSRWTQSHVNAFDSFGGGKIISLNEKLKELQEKLKTDKCFKIVSEIRKIVASLKELANSYVNKLGHLVKSYLTKLTCCFKRNVRLIYRQLIQFLFKNMDDEDHDVITSQSVIQHHFFIFQQACNDLQRKNYYRT